MPSANELGTFLKVFMYICAALGTVAAATGIVYKLSRSITKPIKDLTDRVEECERKLLKDHERLNQGDEYNKLVLNAMVTLINHEITGNSIEDLKKRRTEINDYLINK